MQTGASALLAAASIATLYSLVRFFDLFRRNPAVQAEPQRIVFEPAVPVVEAEPQRIELEPAFPTEFLPVRQEARELQAAIEPRLVVDNVVEEAHAVHQPAPVEEIDSPAKPSRRSKAPRKGTARAKASKSTKEIAPAPAESMDIEVPARPEVVEAAEPEPFEESFHAPVAPLFEPEPFVRQQQRAMFGRKSR